jgi:aminocarboxymuconate-semialdehyde decarboxylase
MNDIDAALKEAEKAIREKNFKGVQLFTPVNGKPLDHPDFMDIYGLMSGFDLPIWIHPTGEPSVPDYSGEDESKFGLFAALGWPYQSSLAMARLVFSGVFERFPNLKFVIHHCGAMIPFFLHRLTQPRPWLKENPEEYFRKFYVDTAVDGNSAALMCGYSLWGADHILFGTDSPFGGEEKVAKCLATVNSVDIPVDSKTRILYRNAEKLLGL